ncbi:hypothetical protein IW261DRAFT_1422838 [Armillaria novae-zelandiae]|uniref:Uncharacterized protein n=1 Tax=Armillaria novae-zelandiae TaxID=153914 RepID=A0AA39UDC7_9AGAR|nr:hypothetical protein IW261DRAFT_1422838 [Armillaria novae-zelandiae]
MPVWGIQFFFLQSRINWAERVYRACNALQAVWLENDIHIRYWYFFSGHRFHLEHGVDFDYACTLQTGPTVTAGSPICSGDTTCDAGTWYTRANTRLDSSFIRTTISEHVVMCSQSATTTDSERTSGAGPERPQATLTATITTTSERLQDNVLDMREPFQRDLLFLETHRIASATDFPVRSFSDGLQAVPKYIQDAVLPVAFALRYCGCQLITQRLSAYPQWLCGHAKLVSKEAPGMMTEYGNTLCRSYELIGSAASFPCPRKPLSTLTALLDFHGNTVSNTEVGPDYACLGSKNTKSLTPRVQTIASSRTGSASCIYFAALLSGGRLTERTHEAVTKEHKQTGTGYIWGKQTKCMFNRGFDSGKMGINEVQHQGMHLYFSKITGWNHHLQGTAFMEVKSSSSISDKVSFLQAQDF